MMRTRLVFFPGKEGQKYFFNLALDNYKFLYENKYKAFNVYNRETEIRSSVFVKCSIKQAH